MIQFVARKENISDRAAAEKLLGNIPGVTKIAQLEEKSKQAKTSLLAVPDAVRADLLGRVVRFYAKTLHKDLAGLNYLQKRNLTDATMLEYFQVGYCNGSLKQTLPKDGEIIQQLKAIGILTQRGTEFFYGRVVVPIKNQNGEVVGLYGRRLTDEQPKHIYLSGEHRGVFNCVDAKNAKEKSLLLVESIFDAMSLWQAGFKNAVPLYAALNWTPHHGSLIRDNAIQEIYLCLDQDKAGEEGRRRLEEKLLSQNLRVYKIQWPVKDANAFFSSSRNREEFEMLLQAANPNSKPAVEDKKKEQIELTANGFIAKFGEAAHMRRYELCAIERPSAARLRATIKAVQNNPEGRSAAFHIDTVDFYLSRSRRVFISETARLFRENSNVIEADVNQIIAQLESYTEQRQPGEKAATITLLTDSEKSDGLKLGKNPNLIAEIQTDLEKLGLIGEQTNRLLLYLAMTSRKMDDPLAVQILSGSGAGKSYLQDAVLSLCPTEELIKLTSLTGQALFYKGEESLKHKCLAIAEVAGAEGARYALRNLISEKKLVIESTIKNQLSGRLETQLNTVYGPTAVFETTTKPDTDPETKSRYLLLSVDETPQQTRAILEAQRNSHTLDGMKRRNCHAKIRERHHAFQKLLRPLVVVNPFEPLLRYGEDGRLLFRRDHPKYLQLILVVTFLHQLQRPIKHDEQIGDYIETTLGDIAIANDLVPELFSQDDLSSPSRELLKLIKSFVQQKEIMLKTDKVEFYRRELREQIGWSEYRLRVHLKELVDLEYLVPVSGRFGQRFCYRLLALEENSPRFSIHLKSVQQLGKEAKTLGLAQTSLAKPQPRCPKSNLVETSLASFNEVLLNALPLKNGQNGRHKANLVGKNGAYIREIAS